MITRCIVVGAVFLAVSSVLLVVAERVLALASAWDSGLLALLGWPLEFLTDIAPLCGYFGAVLLLTGIMNSVRRKKALEKKALRAAGGQLLFDEIGICDIESDGCMSKYTWARYDCCVITQHVIAFFFDDSAIMFEMMYTPELDEQITRTLTARGLADTIFRRRIR